MRMCPEKDATATGSTRTAGDPILSPNRYEILSDRDTRKTRSVDEPDKLIGTRRDSRPIAYFTPVFGVQGSTPAWRMPRVFPNTGVLINTYEEI